MPDQQAAAEDDLEAGPFIHGNIWIYPIRKSGGKTKLFSQRRTLEIDTEHQTLRNTERCNGKIKWEVDIKEITFLRREAKENAASFDTGKKEYVVSFKDTAARDSFCLLIETIKAGESVASLKKPTVALSSAKFRKSIHACPPAPGAVASPLTSPRPSVIEGSPPGAIAEEASGRSSPMPSDHSRVRAAAVTQFKVDKLRGGKRGRGHQKRIVEVDISVGCIRNLNETGRCKWQLFVKDLLGYRRSKSNGLKGVVEAVKKKYVLMFECSDQRDHFIDLLDLAKTVINEIEVYNFETAPTETISIAVCSWNLGNSLPPSDLSDWIRSGYDLYAIGVQEAYYKLGETSEEDTCRKDWIEKLEAHFPLQEYALIGRAFLWEMTLCIYAKRKHLGKLSNIQKDSKATGLAHVLGNKGGLVVKLQFMETTICFVSSHLAAFQEGVENRNSNFQEIASGIKFDVDGAADCIEKAHIVIWFGDLNYRIDIPRERVMIHIQDKDWAKLQEADQLKIQQSKGMAFQGFTEGPLLFPPTYRYLRNVFPRVYDDEKARIPAWCDRILWRLWPGVEMTQEYFTSIDTITTSDHSPITALFNAKILRVPRSQDGGRRSAMLPSRYQMSLVQLSLHLQKYGLVSSSEDASPYCKFTASFLSEPFQTGVKSKTLDPRWDGDSIGCIVMVSSKEYLKRQHLFVTVMNSYSMQDNKPIGYSVIPIGPSLIERQSAVVPIRKDGLEIGKLDFCLAVDEL